MIALRLISGSIEITAALLMLKLNDLEKAFLYQYAFSFSGSCDFYCYNRYWNIGLTEKIPLKRGILLFSRVLLIILV
jgi:hypothetical protein